MNALSSGHSLAIGVVVVLIASSPIAVAIGAYGPAPTQRLTGDVTGDYGEAVAMDDGFAAIDSNSGVDIYQQNAGTWQKASTIEDGSWPSALSLSDGRVTIGDVGDYLDIYSHAPDGWTQTARLTSPATDDNFATSADLDGDTLAVGADWDDTVADNAGAVYIYEHNTTTDEWERQTKLAPTDLPEDAFFGQQLTLSQNTLAVTTSDGVHVFERLDTTWTQTASFARTAVGGTYDYGDNLALTETTLVVSDDEVRVNDNPGAGAAFVYQRTDNNWTLTQRVTDPIPEPNGRFAADVSLTPNQLVVGAPNAHVPNGEDRVGCFEIDLTAVKVWNCRARPAEGNVYTYTRTPTGEFHYTQTLTPTDRTGVGSAIAADDSTVLGGAPGDGETGAAYVWTGVGTGSVAGSP